MTKGELIKLLEPLGDDQHCCIALFDDNDHLFNGKKVINQIAIQAVKLLPPWHGAQEDKSNWIIGITGHRQNRVLGTKEKDNV